MIKYASQLEVIFRKRKRRVSGSWRMDETYIKVKGRWLYYYRAMDKYGAIIDFYLSETRDEPAARAFSNKASVTLRPVLLLASEKIHLTMPLYAPHLSYLILFIFIYKNKFLFFLQ